MWHLQRMSHRFMCIVSCGQIAFAWDTYWDRMAFVRELWCWCDRLVLVSVETELDRALSSAFKSLCHHALNRNHIFCAQVFFGAVFLHLHFKNQTTFYLVSQEVISIDIIRWHHFRVFSTQRRGKCCGWQSGHLVLMRNSCFGSQSNFISSWQKQLRFRILYENLSSEASSGCKVHLKIIKNIWPADCRITWLQAVWSQPLLKPF